MELSIEIDGILRNLGYKGGGHMEEQLKNIREVISELIVWASGAGLGFEPAAILLHKLYSGCEEDVRQ